MHPPSEFDRATAVTPRDGGTVHDVTVDPGWTIGDKPNGGYLLAVLARAAAGTAAAVEGPAHPHPLAATATYVAPPALGPAEVDSEVLRRGRGMSQVRARLSQDGRARVEATITLGRLDAAAEPWWGGTPAPVVPPPEDALSASATGPSGMHLPIMDRVDLRLDPATAGFREGRPGGGGELRGWLSFRDGRDPDPLSLLYALDALPPATFEVAAATGWVPTLSLTAYVRAVPAPGPLLVRQRAGLVEGRLVDEVCEVWDGRGRLVAHGTQLAAIRTR